MLKERIFCKLCLFPVRITNLKVKAPHKKQSIRIRVSSLPFFSFYFQMLPFFSLYLLLQVFFLFNGFNLFLKVAWGNNKVTDAFKTPKELLGFHQKVSIF